MIRDEILGFCMNTCISVLHFSLREIETKQQQLLQKQAN